MQGFFCLMNSNSCHKIDLIENQFTENMSNDSDFFARNSIEIG